MTTEVTTEQIPHPGRNEIELGAVLHALSDSVRLKIVAALAQGDGELSCGSFEVPVTKSATKLTFMYACPPAERISVKGCVNDHGCCEVIEG